MIPGISPEATGAGDGAAGSLVCGAAGCVAGGCGAELAASRAPISEKSTAKRMAGPAAAEVAVPDGRGGGAADLPGGSGEADAAGAGAVGDGDGVILEAAARTGYNANLECHNLHGRAGR